MSCIWIFTAEMSIDHAHEFGEHEGETNWIIYGGYEDMDVSQLYLTGFYYTVTTISTVGYGDISG